MSDTLNSIERRVLGVLLEKALAQPQYYPMTLNAIVAACNQKNNRDPVMDLDEDAIWTTLDVLRQKGLVSRLMPGGGARTDRFKQEAQTVFGWEKPQRAAMAELLLRGPQTIGELRTRCARMFPFENLESVTAVLDGLMQRQPPHVSLLPRAPGQSVVRYGHLFYPEKDRPTDKTASAQGEDHALLSTATTIAATTTTSATDHVHANEIEALQLELADVHEALAELRRRVVELERRIQ